MKKTLKAMTGMTAAAQAAYALSEMAVIFPITPASHMAETFERWSASEMRNLFDEVPSVKEMQSEKGVSATLHGCLSGGVLASTMTASQGLLLMIPNMYKIAGEMLPGVFHVTCRSLATHALSIFGDHQDIMATRATGVAMLASASVQECQDLSWVAHLAAIEASLPIVHFFDGFRTSDEVQTIEVLHPKEMKGLIDAESLARFRRRAMDPEHPDIRGTAQNPDVYFQNAEARNSAYDGMGAIVQKYMDAIAEKTGRHYKLFDYAGSPNAERVIVAMASACETIEKTVCDMVAKGEKVGVVKVRLYRPFSVDHLLEAIPDSAKVVCALDRTKEPGSLGEPLLLDVSRAFSMSRPHVVVIGGRYGLSSKEFAPRDAKAVFDNMSSENMLGRFTVGINDDVTHLSLEIPDYSITPGKDVYQAIFYGFGSDGTVSANKAAASIVGDIAGRHVQEYSWFDSKKSGGLSISYMRFGDDPIRCPWLIEEADYVACNKGIYVKRDYGMLDNLKDGGTFVLNAPWTDITSLEANIPEEMRSSIAEKGVRLFVIDAESIAAKYGLGPRINMIMETVFFKLSGVMDFDRAITSLKEAVAKAYASKGKKVVEADQKAIDEAIGSLVEMDWPKDWAKCRPSKKTGVSRPDSTKPYSPQNLDDFLERVFWPVEHLRGNELPVSALDPAGIVPSGTSAYEKRCVANDIPEWDASMCVECGRCSLVCSHAAIRPYVATGEELKGHPESYVFKPCTANALSGLNYRIQVYPRDCVGCGSCVENCPGHALTLKPLQTQLDVQERNLEFACENISLKEDALPATGVLGTQLRQPLLEFSGCCGGCGETPYVKLLTQLFGDGLIIANATGCSSIWGAYMPSMPYATNAEGRGPAWANSLFEDNAEYGFGIAEAVRIKRHRLESLAKKAVSKGSGLSPNADKAIKGWLSSLKDGAASTTSPNEIKGILECELEACKDDSTKAIIDEMLDLGEMFSEKSVWAIGGDGWAYDIDFDGVDEVLASGRNINLLVLDTEGYSNTGGEMSKATELGSVSGFSLDGKPTPRKRLGTMMADYEYVYVAQICLGADMSQTITALREAASYEGPSIVIALCPCISWGIEGGMRYGLAIAKEGVEAGYWPLFRYDPRRLSKGEDPWIMDYGKPDGELDDFLKRQRRFATLAQREPRHARILHGELAKDIDRQYRELEEAANGEIS